MSAIISKTFSNWRHFVGVCVLAMTMGATTRPSDFFEICKTGTCDEVTAAIKVGADVNARNGDGWTPLMAAADSTNDPDVIAALVKAGADVNAKDPNGWTALMAAGANTRKSAVIAALVKAGADVNAKNQQGQTALDIAYLADNPPAEEELIKAGAK